MAGVRAWLAGLARSRGPGKAELHASPGEGAAAEQRLLVLGVVIGKRLGRAPSPAIRHPSAGPFCRAAARLLLLASVPNELGGTTSCELSPWGVLRGFRVRRGIKREQGGTASRGESSANPPPRSLRHNLGCELRSSMIGPRRDPDQSATDTTQSLSLSLSNRWKSFIRAPSSASNGPSDPWPGRFPLSHPTDLWI